MDRDDESALAATTTTTGQEKQQQPWIEPELLVCATGFWKREATTTTC
jgi:hypothetical protein